MPRAAKGPRLWLQPERWNGGYVERAVWYILDDGRVKLSTGCGQADRVGAESKLAEYLDKKRLATRPKLQPAEGVKVADVLAIYSADVAVQHARPREALARIERLIDWWGERRLSEVTGRTCRLYAEERGSVAAARRELEDLRAAIKYHRREGLCREVVEVILPEKAPPRQRWLTREEAARLIWSAWRYREEQKGHPTGKRSRRHVARFILVALYTGSRSGVVCASSFQRREGFGWIDTKAGVFYRRPENEAETKKRRPPVRLSPRLLAHLRRWERGVKERDGKDLVTVRLDYPVQFQGGPVADVKKAFARAAEDAGLPDVTPHTLRHTAATWLMQAGVDKREAAGFLGMSEAVMERVYSHHSPDYQAGAAEAIGRRRKA